MGRFALTAGLLAVALGCGGLLPLEESPTTSVPTDEPASGPAPQAAVDPEPVADPADPVPADPEPASVEAPVPEPVEPVPVPEPVVDPSLSTAHMVIMGGARSKDAAQATLDGVVASSSKLQPFLRLVRSDEVVGLNPGFWIVVAATVGNARTAGALARGLDVVAPGTYVRKVHVLPTSIEAVTCPNDPRCEAPLPSGDLLPLTVPGAEEDVEIVR